MIYKGTCKLCDKTYYGETGDNGVNRIKQHRKSILKKDSGNAFAKYLQIEHPAHQGNHKVFDIKVEKVFKKPLERQVMEEVMIAATDSRQTFKLEGGVPPTFGGEDLGLQGVGR